MLLNNGIGTAADQKEALQWFEKSAEAGHPLGTYKLGCYYHGQFPGVIEPDFALGLKYKLVAAEQGYDLAQSDVAKRYYADNNFTEAVRWWTEAAKQGDPESMYHLGEAYAQGQGAPADLILSYRYLDTLKRMPEFGSDQFITDALAWLTNKMSADELAAAKNAAAFVAEPSALTLKAREGISEAKNYLADNMP
jgi:TPR repeat protein